MLRLSTRLILSLLLVASAWAVVDTFTPPASGDDGQVAKQDSTWPPPTGGATPDDTSVGAIVRNSWTGSVYIINNGLVRFNTASLPDTAIITAATLRLRIVGTPANADSLTFGAEYYSAGNWPIDSADYTGTPSSSAHGYTAISSFTPAAYNDFALTSPEGNINKTGYTGFRLHVRATSAPAGDNQFTFRTFDNTTDKPELVVTYVLGGLFTTVVVAGD